MLHQRSRTEASCAAVVRTARGIVEDVGPSAASKSQGLLDIAQRSEKNAERDCHQVLAKKYHLALPIARTMLDTGDAGWQIPILSIRDWAQYLIDSNHSHMLVGLLRPDWKREAAILKAFWGLYELHEPNHPIFTKARLGMLNLSQTYPMLLHGDEGRGRKRTAFLVMSWYGLLGRGLKVHGQSKKPGQYLKMRPNYHGSTLTSRFLFASLPKVLYTHKNASVFDALLERTAQDAEFMMNTGIKDGVAGRGQFHMVLLHVVGDWPWLTDSGRLTRSFRNVPKHVSRKKPPTGVCHWCQAGQPGCDFEQVNSYNPKWLETMFTQSVSDPAAAPSPLLRIAHPPGKEASLFMWDLFHTWHLGVAKAFLSSAVALLSDLEDAGGIDDRFSSLTDKYMTFCKLHGRRPHVTRLSKELLNWGTRNVYPNGSWHKADLSTSLMTWFQDLYLREGESWSPMLKLAGEAALEANAFLGVLYNADAWLTLSEARSAATSCMKFLAQYASLATMAMQQKQMLWTLQPKIHILHHLGMYLWQGFQRGHRTLNILVFACQASEDFIGKPSRLARRVTAKPEQTCQRVLSRYLEAAYAEWIKVGYIIRPQARSG